MLMKKTLTLILKMMASTPHLLILLNQQASQVKNLVPSLVELVLLLTSFWKRNTQLITLQLLKQQPVVQTMILMTILMMILTMILMKAVKITIILTLPLLLMDILLLSQLVEITLNQMETTLIPLESHRTPLMQLIALFQPKTMMMTTTIHLTMTLLKTMESTLLPLLLLNQLSPLVLVENPLMVLQENLPILLVPLLLPISKPKEEAITTTTATTTAKERVKVTLEKVDKAKTNMNLIKF